MNKQIAVAYSIAGLAVAASLITVVMVSKPDAAQPDAAPAAASAEAPPEAVPVSQPLIEPGSAGQTTAPQVEYVYETAPARSGRDHERHEREEHDDDDD